MTSELLGRAGFAYLHEISFMVCFAALVLERKLLRPNPDRASATQLIITDVVYGIAALTLLLSGIARVYRDDPARVRESVAEMTGILRTLSAPLSGAAAIPADLPARAARAISVRPKRSASSTAWSISASITSTPRSTTASANS
jgi:hypothetical protein